MSWRYLGDSAGRRQAWRLAQECAAHENVKSPLPVRRHASHIWVRPAPAPADNDRCWFEESQRGQRKPNEDAVWSALEGSRGRPRERKDMNIEKYTERS